MNAMHATRRIDHCPVSRREFLRAGCAACLGMAGWTAGLAETAAGTARRSSPEPKRRLRIRILYALHKPVQPGPDWPNVGYDFRPVMAWIGRILRTNCPEFEFLEAMANGPQAAKKVIQEDQQRGVDGYIVVQLNCWNRVVQSAVATGKPVLYVDYKYAGSGGFLVYTASFLRRHTPNFAFLSSSEPDDLVAAVRCFPKAFGPEGPEAFVRAVQQLRIARTPGLSGRQCLADPLKPIPVADCLKELAQMRMLAVRGNTKRPAGQILGIQIQEIPFAELNQAWKEADPEEAATFAERWKKEATHIQDVNDQTLLNSAKMYVGMKSLLQRYGAQAITVNCLGGFYGGHLHAYPCLGFHELNNQGLVGGCECDVRSTAMLLLVRTLTNGRPGYISDPVLDSARRQIIYAHCVAPNRMFGPQGPTNPFWIMTHSEDRKGASVRSFLPPGYLVTSIQCRPAAKQLLLHQARTVGNDQTDRACRTKLCAEPLGDFEKLYTMWNQWGWHRVTVYGDLKEPLRELTERVGWKLIEEG